MKFNLCDMLAPSNTKGLVFGDVDMVDQPLIIAGQVLIGIGYAIFMEKTNVMLVTIHLL